MSPLPGVVLLHGLARTSRSFRTMERALQGSGFATLNVDYASRKHSLEVLVEDIHPQIAGFVEKVGRFTSSPTRWAASWREFI